jgi:hypothetical protein
MSNEVAIFNENRVYSIFSNFFKDKIDNLTRINQLSNNIKYFKNLELLDEFKNFKKDWNNNLADPFNEDLIEKCKILITIINIQPKIYPTARDSIQFEYNHNENYLEFEIFDNKIEYFIEYKNGKTKEAVIIDLNINLILEEFYGY